MLNVSEASSTPGSGTLTPQNPDLFKNQLS
jgi:hypothetical protein